MSRRTTVVLMVLSAVGPYPAGGQWDHPIELKDDFRGGNPQECDAGEAPDIVAPDIHEVSRWGHVGEITAYSIASWYCNAGTCWLDFFLDTNRHPVIAQNMFRLKPVNGAIRFEQIGMSWLYHTFFAGSSNFCFSDCQPTTGEHLGVHCADVDSASLYGQQSLLGPRSQVNPASGDFPYPFSASPPVATIGRRLQVHDADLDPALNAGAIYFAEVQFIAADDALGANADNNASHRRVQVGAGPVFNLSFVGGFPTRRERAAIRAWKEHGLGVGVPDPAIEERDIQVPGDGLFILAAKATDLGEGFWRYEYAIQNLNSHRAARSFAVPCPLGTTVRNAGFHDVDYHSGEPYDLADWTITVGSNGITWSTETFEENENANALRWGTLYNFRFDANVSPGIDDVTLGLFRSGSPDQVQIDAVTPAVGVPAATMVGAVSRRSTPHAPGYCDTNLNSPQPRSEPHLGGIQEVRIEFDTAPAGGGSGAFLFEATCAAPSFVPSAQAWTGEVSGNELVLSFSPGLGSARTYRINLGPTITAIAGQAVTFRGLVGDVNGDGRVNATDRSVIAGAWTGGGFCCTCDIDNSGVVNGIDRSVVVGAWTGSANCAP